MTSAPNVSFSAVPAASLYVSQLPSFIVQSFIPFSAVSLGRVAFSGMPSELTAGDLALGRVVWVGMVADATTRAMPTMRMASPVRVRTGGLAKKFCKRESGKNVEALE